MIKSDIPPADFLKPTKLIESQHPDIISAATKITAGAETDIEKAEKL
ncbi:hypothetical protein GF337_16485, partial [candidate division KSB1 bacterium]|nr:hypothetical protein [candidate division KSB1 bacterium]